MKLKNKQDNKVSNRKDRYLSRTVTEVRIEQTCIVRSSKFQYRKHSDTVMQTEAGPMVPGSTLKPFIFSTAVGSDIFSPAWYLGYLTMIKYICYIYSWCPGDALDKVAKCK